MILIVVSDNNMGISLNRFRLSQDPALLKRILAIAKGKPIWMTQYTAEQFAPFGTNVEINVSEAPCSEALQGEYVFVENELVRDYKKWIEQIILFRWNCKYSSDLKFDIDVFNPARWKLLRTEDFVGETHERLTMTVYQNMAELN